MALIFGRGLDAVNRLVRKNTKC